MGFNPETFRTREVKKKDSLEILGYKQVTVYGR